MSCVAVEFGPFPYDFPSTLISGFTHFSSEPEDMKFKWQFFFSSASIGITLPDQVTHVCACPMQLISAKSLLTHAGGLAGLYGDILSFIPECCSLLLELTQGPPSGGSAAAAAGDITVKGFDFLVNSIWPEIVSTLERKASVIFAPGNPDAFHKVHTYVCPCCSASKVS